MINTAAALMKVQSLINSLDRAIAALDRCDTNVAQRHVAQAAEYAEQLQQEILGSPAETPTEKLT